LLNFRAQQKQNGGAKITFEPDKELLKSFVGNIIVIKYGGNAMTDAKAQENVLRNIAQLKRWGVIPVVVHGGGPFIKKALKNAGIKSEFVDGHRKTGSEAIKYVEMALSGQVNGNLVKLLNGYGCNAVGLTGKDGQIVKTEKRMHEVEIDGKTEMKDLGHVGNVASINPHLIRTLIAENYTPVLAPVAAGDDLEDYNINADMFAGHLAGALNAMSFIALTNVDGLLRDIDDPDSLIKNITTTELKARMGDLVQGGMIPKVEACMIALRKGADQARIINGLRADSILKTLLTDKASGTVIQ